MSYRNILRLLSHKIHFMNYFHFPNHLCIIVIRNSKMIILREQWVVLVATLQNFPGDQEMINAIILIERGVITI